MRPRVQLWSRGYRKPLCHQLPPGSCLEGPEHALWGSVSPILQLGREEAPPPGNPHWRLGCGRSDVPTQLPLGEAAPLQLGHRALPCWSCPATPWGQVASERHLWPQAPQVKWSPAGQRPPLLPSARAARPPRPGGGYASQLRVPSSTPRGAGSIEVPRWEVQTQGTTEHPRVARTLRGGGLASQREAHRGCCPDRSPQRNSPGTSG